MSIQLKLMPAFVTLLAGAITSIITYLLHYESKTACIILLAVLLFFYILSSILQKLIRKFEKENEKEEQETVNEEGTVVEKEITEEETGDEQ